MFVHSLCGKDTAVALFWHCSPLPTLPLPIGLLTHSPALPLPFAPAGVLHGDPQGPDHGGRAARHPVRLQLHHSPVYSCITLLSTAASLSCLQLHHSPVYSCITLLSHSCPAPNQRPKHCLSSRFHTLSTARHPAGRGELGRGVHMPRVQTLRPWPWRQLCTASTRSLLPGTKATLGRHTAVSMAWAGESLTP